jgi:murein DD-endopeptidase MepM/ murein hydrolase activator NlpD
VKIDHGNGLVLLYAQLQDYSVKAGDKVGAGDVFAHVGSSGRSTGPHVHIESFRDGKRVDPATVLNLLALKLPKS